MILVVGLGNPGLEYSKTRHNIGFTALERVAKKYQFENWKSKLKGLYAQGMIGRQRTLLLKPQTFMNLSGSCVSSFKKYFKLDENNIYVIYDDIDLDLGKLKTKFGGGHAGHNGVKSICENLQSTDFYKIRIGVGRPEQKEKVASYVLAKFFNFELDIVESILDKISDDLENIISSKSL